jgi:imidazolonepropionase-like amidohydrolase
MLTRAFAALLLLVSSAFAASYRFGEVWDGDKVQKNVCVNVQGDKIQSVGQCPAGAIDMSRYTAIPGMIDVHTHMTYVQENPVSQSGRGAAVVYLAAANAKKTLETGVTTVRDLGSQNYSDIAMRDLIKQETHDGPAHVRGGLRPADSARCKRHAQHCDRYD